MQHPRIVHDTENARETEYEEVRSGVHPEAVQSPLLSVSVRAFLSPVPIRLFISPVPVQHTLPSARAQPALLAADARHITVSTDERPDFARICTSGNPPDLTSAICGPHSCTCSPVGCYRTDYLIPVTPCSRCINRSRLRATSIT